ncbi:nucleotidyltransferase substrate binding protein (TIGR01987 family) [Sporomusaceae bacterium BoRhaA]|uniref:nucleotidyltransferase substrate binding protein n=1 Tax=Pelorhabdus rhamnosifermentans TaxID=2772457 RepID=UPI001C060DB8|nr:nucleotidyltransferase substrate binding protein [Pelorhabdus rhamnosifermentans]MBU2700767.1 nucleotidyltransferase substrate binding protein (TIGR01987 family) [Pelorhabdus rhamnosifermentans]
MSDCNQKFKNYQNALRRLREGVVKVDQTNDLLRDGLIQRFEFTFELAWKTLKAIFEDEGLVGLNSPKTVFREAFAAGLIKKDELWLAMLSDRNITAHIYDEQLAREICSRIIKDYTYELIELESQIKMRMGI